MEELVGIVLVDMKHMEVASSYVVDFAIVVIDFVVVLVACDSSVVDDTFVVDQDKHCTSFVMEVLVVLVAVVVVLVVVLDWKQDFVYSLFEMVSLMMTPWAKLELEPSSVVDYSMAN